MPRWVAVCTALFVTFLWSTSYILNKWAFADGIGPFTLAGLRYGIAALTLAVVKVVVLRRSGSDGAPGQGLSPLQYAGLGIAGYLVAQGFQYVGQYFVTPTQSGMVLSVGNPTLVLVTGYFWLRELPGRYQWMGIVLSLAGVAAYYYPWNLEASSLAGIGMLLLSGTGYAVQVTANRSLLQRQAARPLDLVLYPMAAGAAGMLLLAVALEPWPAFSWRLVAILLWLGTVNGALAFFLFTWAQKSLQAFETSALNNTMLIQIALLDMGILGRGMGLRQGLALVTAAAGIFIVQTARRRSS